jgi:hypothetical protein
MLIALALSLLTIAPPDTARGQIRGSVQSESSGVPLDMAVVEVTDDAGRTLSTLTDSTGAYLLRWVPAGRRTLRVHDFDHAPAEVQVLVPGGGEVVLDLSLRPQPLALEPVFARGTGPAGLRDTARAGESDMAMVGARTLESGMGATAAALATTFRAPGQDPSDPRDALYVRGSAADLKLVLLDGAPVYAPFHMGGLIQSFQPEALGSATLFLGGAPARYDGGLSYVMELNTRAGKPGRAQGSGSVDLVSADVVAEGPLGGGATYLASGRGVGGGMVALMQGQPFPYAYREGLARVDWSAGGGAMAVTVFSNQEGVRVDTVPGDDDFARWSNTALSARWRGALSGGQAEVTAAVTGFGARLPWRGSRDVLLDGTTRRGRLAADLSRLWGSARVLWGGSVDRTWVQHRAYTMATADGDSLVVDDRSTGDALGMYVDVAWQPAARLTVRGGTRGDIFVQGRIAGLSPRFSATWLAGDRVGLTLAAGRYHQYVQVPGQAAHVAPHTLGDSLHLPTGLDVARATHVSLALDQELGDEVRLGLEGYYKMYEGLDGSPHSRSDVSGVDVWVRRNSGVVTGWLGYSLTWAHAVRDEDVGADAFAGRQLLSAGVAGPLGRPGRFQVRVAYGAGLPYTAVSVAAAEPGGVTPQLQSSDVNEPAPLARPGDDPYLRVDAEVSRTWSPRLAGRRRELTPYLRVLNALDRRDALFYRYDGGGAGPRSVATLPILPIAGLSFRF